MCEVKIPIKKNIMKNLILRLYNLKSGYKNVLIQTQLILKKDCPLHIQRHSMESVHEC